MSYEWDVFISYRRSETWNDFVAFLVRQIAGILDSRLTRATSVFLDRDAIPYGGTWPDELAEAHGRSRLLVPLLWGGYFAEHTTWCREELSLMLARRDAVQAASENRLPPRLVLPITLVDFEKDREQARLLDDLQTLDLTRLSNPHVKPGTPRAEQIWDALQPWGKQLVTALTVLRDLATDRVHAPPGARTHQAALRPLLQFRRASPCPA